jgi:hypothetical protein
MFFFSCLGEEDEYEHENKANKNQTPAPPSTANKPSMSATSASA